MNSARSLARGPISAAVLFHFFSLLFRQILSIYVPRRSYYNFKGELGQHEPRLALFGLPLLTPAANRAPQSAPRAHQEGHLVHSLIRRLWLTCSNGISHKTCLVESVQSLFDQTFTSRFMRVPYASAALLMPANLAATSLRICSQPRRALRSSLLTEIHFSPWCGSASTQRRTMASCCSAEPCSTSN